MQPSLDQLPTPCALVDLDVLERNATRMREKARRLGVRLRPHVKTHETVEAARHQLGDATGPLTVSTLAEARAFAAAGFRDLTWAVPVAPARLSEAADLARGMDRLGLLVDHEATLAEVERLAAARGIRVSLFLKVDCGYHRAGVDPSRPESLALGVRMGRSPRVAFRGVLTHSGHAYACRNPEEIRVVARQERDVIVGFAERLRAEGVSVPEVSVGSTPALSVADDLAGVTEVRPGNYVFHDAFQATIGSCGWDDVAFSVLATVIGVYPERGRAVIDAGALALSKDAGATHVEPTPGYGRLRTADGARDLPDLQLVAISQEHGTIEAASPEALAHLRVGARVRVVPNHSCLAAACFDRHVVTRGGRVVEEWATIRGW